MPSVGRLNAASIAESESWRPRKCNGTRIGMLETAKTFPGNAAAAGASRFRMNSPKRKRAASSGMPNSSQRRMWSASVGSRHGFTATNSTKPGRLPDRRVAFEGGVGRLQVLVGNNAEHMIGGVMALLHPAIDVAAALDLP